MELPGWVSESGEVSVNQGTQCRNCLEKQEPKRK
jgi:hypothetical protein